MRRIDQRRLPDEGWLSWVILETWGGVFPCEQNSMSHVENRRYTSLRGNGISLAYLEHEVYVLEVANEAR